MTKSQTVDDALDELQGEKVQLPATIARNEARVERGFWKKIGRVAGFIPFAEDLLAAYYCARDPDTPTRVRAVLLGALAYFVLPLDAVPDFIAAFGFTDDATVLMTAIGLVAAHLKPEHRDAARMALGKITGQTGSPDGRDWDPDAEARPSPKPGDDKQE